jgi:hypothetical protein
MVTLATGIATAIAGNGTKTIPAEGAIALGSPFVQSRGVREIPGRTSTFWNRAETRCGSLILINKAGFHTILGPGIEPALDQRKEAVIDSKGDLLFIYSNHGMIRKYSPATGKTMSSWVPAKTGWFPTIRCRPS